MDQFETLIDKIGRLNGKKVKEAFSYHEKIHNLQEISKDIDQIQVEERKVNSLLKYPLVRVLCVKQHLVKVLKLTTVACFIYFMFYGVSVNVQGLGIKDIKVNGILLGSMETLGIVLVLPFVARMKRKTWTIGLQSLAMAGACILLISSLFFDINHPTVLVFQSLVSSVLVAAVIMAILPIFLSLVSESFPPELRGCANSLVNSVSTILASLSPILGQIATDMHLHFIVGCSVLGILSLPLSFTIKETLTSE